MSIESTLFSALGPLVGGRCYPMGGAPDTPVAPYIIYMSVADRPSNTLSNGPAKRNRRIQVDGYVTTFPGIKTLELAIRAAMLPIALEIASQDLYEPVTKLHRTLQEYSIWY